MKLHILGIALLAACSAAAAQTQSGSSIGSNTGGSASTNTPAPLPVPSTGTNADAAGARGTTPRTSETSVGASGAYGTPDTAGRSSGRCDTLIGDERARCLREQASTGTTGPGSTGMSTGATR
jgi:hypothetical protein